MSRPSALRRPRPGAAAQTASGPPRRLCFARRLAAAVAAAASLLAAAASGSAQTDGRVIVEAMEYPWSAIGRVNARGSGHCTGFLVGPQHVMTAAHCLYNAVEGRWLGSNELHFVAGYQRDQFIIHSAVSSYEKSERFDATSGPSATTAPDDWAILTLEQAIGHSAGWLGLMAPDAATLQTLLGNSHRLMQAGYRRGRSHAMTANPGCRILGGFADGRGLAHDCAVFHGDSGSPLLLFAGGEVQVIGMEVVLFELEGRRVGAAISMSAFRREYDSQAADALRRIGDTWRGGSAPEPGAPAAQLPFGTIDQLLARLGYAQDANPVGRGDAIRAFQADQGLAVTGQPSLTLLVQLFSAAR